MSLQAQTRLLGRFMRDAQRLGFDAVAEPFGAALPLLPRSLARAEVLNRLLREHGIGLAANASVTSVELLDIKSISSNCNNVVIRVDSGSGQGSLPSTLFVKLPSTNLWTRLFCNLLGIWSNECHFYRHAASRVPFPVPKPYVVADRGSRFALVLEDLGASGDLELFTNPDMIAGVSVERAKRCLSAFAALHAEFDGLGIAEREAILPASLHPFRSPTMRALSPLLSRAALGPCHRKAPDLFPQDIVSLYQQALSKYDALLDRWYSEPLTLIHGDSHLGNFFVADDGMGMLDWQAVQWAKGIRDVQYFLINSMREDVLAANEQALIAHYLAELGRHGVTLDGDEAWAQYRAYAFQTLMTSVVSLGLGTMTDMDEVLEVILARSVAAIRRTDFAGW
ncbi:MAG: phosphotransferase [Myxococcales bacterium]|nr:MAG: phosphotransferase [Myxococcales bacterium]